MSDSTQKILVLCGLVGSGKSTFASELERYNPNFVRISQDVLGSRPACESMALESLKQGKSIIIDRQNFDRKQRSPWIRIGKEFSTTSGLHLEIDLLEFATPYEECSKRLQVRTEHETLKSVREAMGILKLVSKTWVAPTLAEGFDRQLAVVPEGHPGQGQDSIQITFPVTQECIKSIMDRLDSIPRSS